MATQSTRRTRLTPTQARAARRARRDRKRRFKRFAGFAGVITIALFFIFALFATGLPISIGSSGGEGGVGTRYPDQDDQHIPRDQEHAEYNSVPATSGWHYSDFNSPAPWGVYENFIPDEVLIHNLEHAGVGVHYDCPDGCPELVVQLRDIAEGATKVIMSPYANMSTTIALSAWNYLDAFDEFDEDRIKDFIRAHVNSNNAPEPFAR